MAAPGGLHSVPEGKHPVYTTPRGVGAHHVARFMASRGTRAVVVVKGRRPIGIVTPRDLAERVVGGGLSATLTAVESAMTSPLIMIGEWGTVQQAIDLMHQQGISHLPIIRGSGSLVSLVTLDEALRLRSQGAQTFSEFIRATALVAMARRRWWKRAMHAVENWLRDNQSWFFLAVTLALAGAALALLVSRSWRGFQTYEMKHYEPKDTQRQQHEEDKERAKHGP